MAVSVQGTGYLSPPQKLPFLQLCRGAKWHGNAEAKGLSYGHEKYHSHGRARTLPSPRYAGSAFLGVSFGANDIISPCPKQAGILGS